MTESTAEKFAPGLERCGAYLDERQVQQSSCIEQKAVRAAAAAAAVLRPGQIGVDDPREEDRKIKRLPKLTEVPFSDPNPKARVTAELVLSR